ncbi:hypothetical protein DFA_06484 [Cavenderia fasciculata]|uniref:Uncharacterized protein n=1 Tax=Cavenderia fasciculata TaxID=261658 RepID=F4PJ48_CACFS|nr:uncharacterized protein DFA_06484 [Cavenderia fasciculata]EGG24334.1 hypothetical protein DFA_06484 [Cavenderia fasciculata]|eukprot:XP_004362185.1 hypothetical protein DFA_06484 [Cavenderia fasciculata]
MGSEAFQSCSTCEKVNEIFGGDGSGCGREQYVRGGQRGQHRGCGRGAFGRGRPFQRDGGRDAFRDAKNRGRTSRQRGSESKV